MASRMFTATPPSVARKKSGGGRNAGDRELPYVAVKNNYSYGSPHSNMPKPPQLAETKVPLAVALKQQQEASSARMREQQLERDRVSRQQGTAEPDEYRSVVSEGLPVTVSSSMPPPPRRSPRLRSEASEHSFSMGFDSTLGMSRSYHSEDDVGIVLGRKFTQNLADIPDDIDDASTTDEDDPDEDIWFGGALRGGADPNNRLPEGLGGSSSGLTSGPKVTYPDLSNINRPPPVDGTVPIPIPIPNVTHPKGTDPVPPPKNSEFGPEDFDPPETYGFDWAFWHWNHWLCTASRKAVAVLVCFFLLSNLWVLSLDRLFGLDVRNFGSSPFTYIPPSTPPRDFSEIRTRIHSVEKEVGKFGIHYNKLTTGYTNMINQEVNLLKETIERAKADGDITDDQLKTELKHLQKLQELMRMNYGEVSDELLTLKRQVNEFLQNLPGKIVATQLDDGTYKFSEGFEKILEDVLMQRASSIIVPGTGAESTGLAMAIPGWNAFLADNKQQLQDLIDEHTGIKLDKRGGVMLSHGTIKLLIEKKVQELENYQREHLVPEVRKEIERYKTETLLLDIEKYKTNTWLPDVSTALEKYKTKTWLPGATTALEQYKTKTWLPAATAALEAYKTNTLLPAATNAVRKIISNIPIQEYRPEAGTSYEALDQYADYASQLIGGMISPFITSPSYDYTSAGNRWYYWIFGRPQRAYPAPVTAITPTKEVGSCWPFAGDHGTIGIRLARPLFITHVSVEHVPPQIAIDISSAPRGIEFWARFDNEDDRNRVENAASGVTSEKAWGPGRLWDRSTLDSPEGPSGDVFSNFVKLGEFTYDISKGTPHVQTHRLGLDMTNLNITARTVIFRFVSNWGHPSYTCVYQVKVHGDPPSLPEVHSEGTWGGGE